MLAAKEGRGGIVHFGIQLYLKWYILFFLWKIYILPRNINKVVSVNEAVLGDLTQTLPKLLAHIQYSPRTEWFATINKYCPPSHRSLLRHY